MHYHQRSKMAKLHMITLITLFLLATTTTAQPPKGSLIYSGCSPVSFPPNSAFSTSLNSLLTALTNSATTSQYNHLDQNGVVHGLYQCRGDLPAGSGCSSCITDAISQLTATCPSSTAGAVMLQRCYIQYGVRFLIGVEDTSVMFKRCGPSVGVDVAPDGDSVLTGLLSNVGPYRVVKSGSEQGMTQCLGDLSVDQCTDCVDHALDLIKTECSSAAFGDMFLVKCYARFSPAKSGHGFQIRLSAMNSTVIIVVSLAAAVILILLLTYYLYRKRRAPAPPAPEPAPAPHSHSP